MLDGARDADRDIDVGRDDLAGLADLIVVGGEARVHRRAAGADRGTELVRERLDERVELLFRAERTAAGDDHRGAGELGTRRLLGLGTDEARPALVAGRGDGFDAGVAAFGRCLFEAGGAHGDDLLGVARLHGRDRIAGVDRANERVGALDRDDVADLHDVEQRCDARGDILADRGGVGEEGVVVGHQRHHQGGDILGQHVRIRRIVRQQHLRDARNLRHGVGGLRGGVAVSCDQRDHVTQLGSSGKGGERRVLHAAVELFDQYQHAHAITPRLLILSTSASTLSTLMPAARLAGSSTLRIVIRGERSTP